MIYFKLPIAPPEGSNGAANLCFVRIRKGYENDKGLLEHEKVHVWQFWRTFGLHSLLYLISKRYRLKAEVEAYKVQLEASGYRSDYSAPMLRDKYATWISAPGWKDGYDLQDIVTKEQALQPVSYTHLTLPTNREV